ncbi:hypothetical protein QTP88_001509 [Uroleucon formosanum]
MAEIDSQFKQIEKNDIIEPSFSPWNVPLLLVKNKLDASQIPKFRIVVDFRALNKVTINEYHPLPNITEILDQQGHCNLFSIIDLASGFYQIKLDEKSKELTAFSTNQGLSGYYRKFIKSYSLILKPMTNLLRKGVTLNWDTSCQEAFDKLKNILCSESILQYPDFTKPFIVTTDASGKALGAILSQGEVSQDLPIAYASRTLSKCESGYVGIHRTIKKIKTQFNWRGLKEDVIEYIKNCASCQKGKVTNKKVKQPMCRRGKRRQGCEAGLSPRDKEGQGSRLEKPLQPGTERSMGSAIQANYGPTGRSIQHMSIKRGLPKNMEESQVGAYQKSGQTAGHTVLPQAPLPPGLPRKTLRENNGQPTETTLRRRWRPSRQTIRVPQRTVHLALEMLRTTVKSDKSKVGILTLDMQNAFNSAQWDAILKVIYEKDVPNYLQRIIRSYLENRLLIYESGGIEEEMVVTCGVLQGSVLGLTLWNILYDGLLCNRLPPGLEYLAFANDVALVAKARDSIRLEQLLSSSAQKVHEWLARTELSLSLHNCEAMIITNIRTRNDMNITIDGHRVASSSRIKYLGIHIDGQWRFTDHAKAVAYKAGKVVQGLSRILPNISAAKPTKRKLLSNVAHSIMLYDSLFWAQDMSASGWIELAKIQRHVCLRIVSTYCTVSRDAVGVIASLAPIDLMAKDRKRVYQERKDYHLPPADEDTMAEWQGRWHDKKKDKWTYRLIPDIKRWINRRHGGTFT